jgi:hypothetical protein
MDINLGPVFFRCFSGDNWTSLELGFATNANGGMARRETKLRGSFNSEHLIEALGQDNPADQFTAPDGKVYYGRIHQTPSGVYTISAREVFTRSLYEQAVKTGLREAQESTLEGNLASAPATKAAA